MKHYILLFFLLLSFISYSQVTIEVTNRYPFDRTDELLEIGSAEIGNLNANMVVRDSAGQEVPYQLLLKGKTSC